MDYLGLHIANGRFKCRFLQLAFPYNDDVPALGFQLAPNFLIADLVTRNLCGPEVRVGFRDCVEPAVFMAVPEAAVDEDSCAVFRKNDVGGAGEMLVVNAVTKTLVPEGRTQTQLRLRGCGVNGSHVAMALVGRSII